MAKSVVLLGDLTNAEYGPRGPVITASSTVMANGKPVAMVGDQVAPHGNPYNPSAPGYNPTCAHAVIVGGSGTVMVQGKPMALLQDSRCSCGIHYIDIVGASTVQAGS